LRKKAEALLSSSIEYSLDLKAEEATIYFIQNSYEEKINLVKRRGAKN